MVIENEGLEIERVIFYKDKEHKIVHREDGPAIEYRTSKDKFWIFDNVIHRIGGPAIEYGHGENFYFINGSSYTEEEYWVKIRLGDFV